jgi:hypothetical protein
LATMTMKTKHGERLRPHFKIVGWHDPETQPAPIAPKPAPTAGELMSDSIPFGPEVR